jgi:hypothetical protein
MLQKFIIYYFLLAPREKTQKMAMCISELPQDLLLEIAGYIIGSDNIGLSIACQRIYGILRFHTITVWTIPRMSGVFSTIATPSLIGSQPTITRAMNIARTTRSIHTHRLIAYRGNQIEDIHMLNRWTISVSCIQNLRTLNIRLHRLGALGRGGIGALLPLQFCASIDHFSLDLHDNGLKACDAELLAQIVGKLAPGLTCLNLMLSGNSQLKTAIGLHIPQILCRLTSKIETIRLGMQNTGLTEACVLACARGLLGDHQASLRTLLFDTSNNHQSLAASKSQNMKKTMVNGSSNSIAAVLSSIVQGTRQLQQLSLGFHVQVSSSSYDVAHIQSICNEMVRLKRIVLCLENTGMTDPPQQCDTRLFIPMGKFTCFLSVHVDGIPIELVSPPPEVTTETLNLHIVTHSHFPFYPTHKGLVRSVSTLQTFLNLQSLNIEIHTPISTRLSGNISTFICSDDGNDDNDHHHHHISDNDRWCPIISIASLTRLQSLSLSFSDGSKYILWDVPTICQIFLSLTGVLSTLTLRLEEASLISTDFACMAIAISSSQSALTYLDLCLSRNSIGSQLKRDIRAVQRGLDSLGCLRMLRGIQIDLSANLFSSDNIPRLEFMRLFRLKKIYLGLAFNREIGNTCYDRIAANCISDNMDELVYFRIDTAGSYVTSSGFRVLSSIIKRCHNISTLYVSLNHSQFDATDLICLFNAIQSLNNLTWCHLSLSSSGKNAVLQDTYFLRGMRSWIGYKRKNSNKDIQYAFDPSTVRLDVICRVSDSAPYCHHAEMKEERHELLALLNTPFLSVDLVI